MLVGTACLGVWQARFLFDWYLGQDRLPLWDMAQNGWRGLELALFLEEGRVASFLLALNRHGTWPFGFSLFLVPFFLAAGHGFATATLASAVSFAAVPMGFIVAARCADRSSTGLVAGGLAACLFLTTPLARLFALLVMRELLGCFLLLVCVALYLRAVERDGLRAWRSCGLASLALFFVKYNYGLGFLVSAGLFEIWRRPGAERAAIWGWLRRWLWPWRHGRAVERAVAVCLYLLAGATLFGVNVGGALYGILVIATAVVAARRRRGLARLRDGLGSLPASVRAAVETLVLPIWIWSLSPSPIHPREVLAFLKNRSSDLSFADALLFYPRVFSSDFVAGPSQAWLIGAGVVGALLGFRWLTTAWRFILLLTGVSLIATILHPYKQPRFLITCLPPLLLTAGIGIASLLSRALRTGPLRVAGGLVAGLLVVWTLRSGGLESTEFLARSYPSYSVDPSFRDLAQVLGETAPLRGRVGLLGTFNEFSPALAEWVLKSRPGTSDLGVVASMPRLRSGTDVSVIDQKREDWVSGHRLDEILVVTSGPTSPWFQDADFSSFNAWQLPVIERFLADRRWQVADRRPVAALGVEVIRLRKPS